MTRGDDVPEWAVKRMTRLIHDEPFSVLERDHPRSHRAFARYIMEHEQPPVDPLLIEARKLAATDARNYSDARVKCGSRYLCGEEGAQAILAGEGDGDAAVLGRLAALKRGMELAKERQP